MILFAGYFVSVECLELSSLAEAAALGERMRQAILAVMPEISDAALKLGLVETDGRDKATVRHGDSVGTA